MNVKEMISILRNNFNPETKIWIADTKHKEWKELLWIDKKDCLYEALKIQDRKPKWKKK